MTFLAWLPYTLAATLSFGVSAAFYKLPALKGHSRIASTFWFLFASEVLALLAFHSDLAFTTRKTVILGLCAGAGFAAVTMLQMYALSHVDTNSLFPVTTTLSAIIAIGTGLALFKERLSLQELAGIILAVAVVYLFSRKKGKWQFSPLLLGLTLVIPLISAIFKLLQKVAADTVNIRTFQIYAYLFGAIFALLIYLVAVGITPKSDRKGFFAGAMLWGSANGVFGFLGGVFILSALTKGPFALITPLQSLYVIVTALIGYFFFGESLGFRKCVLIFLALCAVVLMSLG